MTKFFKVKMLSLFSYYWAFFVFVHTQSRTHIHISLFETGKLPTRSSIHAVWFSSRRNVAAFSKGPFTAGTITTNTVSISGHVEQREIDAIYHLKKMVGRF